MNEYYVADDGKVSAVINEKYEFVKQYFMLTIGGVNDPEYVQNQQREIIDNALDAYAYIEKKIAGDKK